MSPNQYRCPVCDLIYVDPDKVCALRFDPLSMTWEAHEPVTVIPVETIMPDTTVVIATPQLDDGNVIGRLVRESIDQPLTRVRAELILHGGKGVVVTIRGRKYRISGYDPLQDVYHLEVIASRDTARVDGHDAT